MIILCTPHHLLLSRFVNILKRGRRKKRETQSFKKCFEIDSKSPQKNKNFFLTQVLQTSLSSPVEVKIN
jgi:hypothetical protein